MNERAAFCSHRVNVNMGIENTLFPFVIIQKLACETHITIFF